MITLFLDRNTRQVVFGHEAPIGVDITRFLREDVEDQLYAEFRQAQAEHRLVYLTPEGQLVDKEPMGHTKAPAPVEYDLGLLDQSVAALKKALVEINDPGHVQALIQAEHGGKTRKSAIAALKERLEQINDNLKE